jgi:hypothetical protein
MGVENLLCQSKLFLWKNMADLFKLPEDFLIGWDGYFSTWL